MKCKQVVDEMIFHYNEWHSLIPKGGHTSKRSEITPKSGHRKSGGQC